MDIELLRTFLEVKTTRHFGKASESLFLTQAAVSSRIRQLESILGVPLFIRHRNNIQLTPAGERLVSHAEEILNAWSRTKNDVLSTSGVAASVSLGTNPCIWDAILQNHIAQLYDNIPELSIKFEVQSNGQLTRKLVERELDLSLVYDPPKSDELKSEPIYTFNLIQVSNKVITGKDYLEKMPYIKVDWGSTGNTIQNNAIPNAPTPVLQTNQSSLAIRYLTSHGGFCYLAENSIKDQLNKTLFPIEGTPVIRHEIYASTRKDYPQRELIEQIIDVLKDKK